MNAQRIVAGGMLDHPGREVTSMYGDAVPTFHNKEMKFRLIRAAKHTCCGMRLLCHQQEGSGFRARASNSHFWMSSNSRQAGSRSPHVSSFANMDWTRRLHNGRVHRSPLSASKVGRFLGKGSSEKRSIVDLINVQRGDVVEILVLPNVAA
jgi:hypothetical protein